MKVLATFGVRPDVIKMAPLVAELKKHPDIELVVAHTGQHFDDEMSAVFLKELMGYEPHQVVTLVKRDPSWSASVLMAEITRATVRFLEVNEFDHVFVYGDHLASLAVSLGVYRSVSGPMLHHVEAGLRSRDLTMPEEMIRMTVDSLADVMYAPTEDAARNLIDEGRPQEHVYVTGNMVVDSIGMVLEAVEKPTTDEKYWVLTLHRPENVDDLKRCMAILDQIGLSAGKMRRPVFYFVHPRVRNRLREVIEAEEWAMPRDIQMLPPASYSLLLTHIQGAELVITDSGGLQEEACILGVPCMTVRKNTERPETIECGANVLVTPDPETNALPMFPEEALEHLASEWSHPYGATPAKAVVEALVREHANVM